MRLNTNTERPEQFYDGRHARGWMDYWSDDKLDRVLSLIGSMLPSSESTVLEYGCGTGTFTMTLKRRFPDLDVHGCDISPKGIEKARARCPEAVFHLLTADGAQPALPKADVIYTHHVLEHVQDVDAVLADIARHLKPGGRVLHILPCGNGGSVEHRLASLMSNGIAQDGTGLFYLDDISHVRRLSSADVKAACAKYGLVSEASYFANQFWGGCEYLSAQLYWGLFSWLNPMKAKDTWAAIQLCALLMVFMPLSLLRTMPPQILTTLRAHRKPWKKIFFFALAPFAAMFYPLSKVLDRVLVHIREWEWRRHKERTNGGEMYLTFVKQVSLNIYEQTATLQSVHP